MVTCAIASCPETVLCEVDHPERPEQYLPVCEDHATVIVDELGGERVDD